MSNMDETWHSDMVMWMMCKDSVTAEETQPKSRVENSDLQWFTEWLHKDKAGSQCIPTFYFDCAPNVYSF